jgi:very-short-patch-repair endonuclease
MAHRRDLRFMSRLMASPPIKRARAMRKAMSPPELALWFQLRALRSTGWHFRRQSPEGPYFLDFVCRSQRLIVEVDGIQHSSAEQSQHDARRDRYLKQLGFRVLRFAAADVMNEIEGVVAAITNELGDAHLAVPQNKPQTRIGGRYGRLVRMGLQQRSSES